jgi:uncharacterized protein with PIN domain
MNLYVDSSAVLAALFNEDGAADVQRCLDDASLIFTSVLTSVECSRSIVRARALHRISNIESLALARSLSEAERAWNRMAIDDVVVERARDAFPVEPIRSLDAIHLASALLALDAFGSMSVLTLDARMRETARALDLALLP